MLRTSANRPVRMSQASAKMEVIGTTDQRRMTQMTIDRTMEMTTQVVIGK
jgi:hypothetical protein